MSEKVSAMVDRTATTGRQAAAGQAALQKVPAPRAQAFTAPAVDKRIWPWVAAGLLAAGLTGLLYLRPWVAPVTEVAAETAALGPVTRVLAVNGRIAGVQSVDVRPLVSGTLAAVLVDEGDAVVAGQALVRMDTVAQQAVVRQALAGFDAALVAEPEAGATYARTEALGTNAARVVLENAARAVQTAAQEVAQMRAVLDQAQIALDHFTLRAPLAGTVLLLAADPGQSVDPATTLMTIADLRDLVVETDVDESYATQISLGQPVALQLSGETAVRPGRVSFVSQRVDEATGGLAVKLTPDAALTAPIGLTVTANITVDDRAEAITVPRAAILRDDRGDAVLMVVEGFARRRAVVVIDWPAVRLIVTEGLVLGDVVITDVTGIIDGQAVKVAP